MERRYLVAALAIIATFAVTSRGFRSLQCASFQHPHHASAWARAFSHPSPAARAMAKVRTHLRPGYPEEAQLLAEMNVPMAEAKAFHEMASQNAAISKCARAEAMREAERARRDAAHMRADMAHARADISIDPIALQLSLPADIDQRVSARTSALAIRIAEKNAKLQIAANQLRDQYVQLTDTEIPAVEVEVPRIATNVATQVHCNVKTAVQQRVQQAVRDATRNLQYSYSYTSK
jgi:hypothetical protein